MCDFEDGKVGGNYRRGERLVIIMQSVFAVACRRCHRSWPGWFGVDKQWGWCGYKWLGKSGGGGHCVLPEGMTARARDMRGGSKWKREIWR